MGRVRWTNWLYAFSVLASCYFLVVVVLAARYALQEFGERGQYLLGGGYLGAGFILASFIYLQARTNPKAKRK